MGINHFVIEPRSTGLVVAGVPMRVGRLANVGRMHDGTRSRIAMAAEAWAGRRAPRAVILPDNEVIGWDGAFSSTNDYDWNKLPVIGFAKLTPDGILALHAGPTSPAPMEADEARARGILDANGRMTAWSRPRVAFAEVASAPPLRRLNESSLGPIEEARIQVSLRMDGGDTERLPECNALSTSAVGRASAELVGKTLEEAWAWLWKNAARDPIPEMARVECVGGTGITIEANGSYVEMVPGTLQAGIDRRQEGITLRDGRGHHLDVAEPEAAFRDAGERLALLSGGTMAFVENCGDLRLSIMGGGDVRLEVRSDGDMAVSSSCADSPEEHVDGAGRQDRVVVPRELAGPFVADFALYLAECGAASLGHGGSAARIPTFGEFTTRNGIDYGQPGVGLRR